MRSISKRTRASKGTLKGKGTLNVSADTTLRTYQLLRPHLSWRHQAGAIVLLNLRNTLLLLLLAALLYDPKAGPAIPATGDLAQKSEQFPSGTEPLSSVIPGAAGEVDMLAGSDPPARADTNGS